jgi:hypothetical protein
MYSRAVCSVASWRGVFQFHGKDFIEHFSPWHAIVRRSDGLYVQFGDSPYGRDAHDRLDARRSFRLSEAICGGADVEKRAS